MPSELLELRVLSMHLDATCYNDARLALLRLGRPLRLKLPGLRGLDFVLDDARWTCVDRAGVDHAVFACTDFARASGSALHLPVTCRVHIYNLHAGMLLRSAFDGLAQALRERLSESSDPLSAA